MVGTRLNRPLTLGPGANPAAIHMADGSVWLFNVADGRLKAKTWQPNTGDVEWDLPNFENEMIATSDKALSLYRLKNIPRVGAFGAWKKNVSQRQNNLKRKTKAWNMGCGKI